MGRLSGGGCEILTSSEDIICSRRLAVGRVTCRGTAGRVFGEGVK
jgi:hypothetical protein